MDKLLRLFQNSTSPENDAAETRTEPMTEAKVNFNFRIYWTKMALRWSADELTAVRAQVEAIREQADFESNLLEKRYHLPVKDVPEDHHSGASLLALLDVLNAFDQYRQESE